MKRHILLCLVLTLSIAMSAKPKLMRDVFKSMPDSLTPYLSHNNKLDMIDYIDSHMRAEVKNNLDGKTVLNQLTDDYLSLQLNDVSKLELLLLPLDKQVRRVAPSDSSAESYTQIICMVQTVGKSIRNSSVRFFTPNWQQLDSTPFISKPNLFFAVRPDTMSVERYEEMKTLASSIEFEYLIDSEKRIITFIPHVTFVSNDEKRCLDQLMNQKTVTWNGHAFVP